MPKQKASKRGRSKHYRAVDRHEANRQCRRETRAFLAAMAAERELALLREARESSLPVSVDWGSFA